MKSELSKLVIMAAMSGGHSRVQNTTHRNWTRHRTRHDHARIEEAEERRERRAAKQHQDYLWAIALNPCLNGGK